jgi:hypothetical protein
MGWVHAQCDVFAQEWDFFARVVGGHSANTVRGGGLRKNVGGWMVGGTAGVGFHGNFFSPLAALFSG